MADPAAAITKPNLDDQFPRFCIPTGFLRISADKSVNRAKRDGLRHRVGRHKLAYCVPQTQNSAQEFRTAVMIVAESCNRKMTKAKQVSLLRLQLFYQNGKKTF
jgi:hypothetical protein